MVFEAWRPGLGHDDREGRHYYTRRRGTGGIEGVRGGCQGMTTARVVTTIRVEGVQEV